MEKLSSILPSSARVKSVDLADAKPRRPGAPNFGAPIGTTSSVRDRISMSNAAERALSMDADFKEKLTYRNPKDFRSSKMAESLTNKFFETRLDPVVKSEEVASQENDRNPNDVNSNIKQDKVEVSAIEPLKY